MTVAVLSSGDLVVGDPLTRILSSCSVIVAADSGLVALHGQQRKADLLVGDLDSLGPATASWSTWADKAETLDSFKDESDTDAAVRFALTYEPDEIWLVAGSGGRMDHWLSNLRLVERCDRIRRWYTVHQSAFRLSQPKSLRLGAGLVSVFPLGTGPWKAHSVGLTWPLDDVQFGAWHSLSNQARDGSSVEALAGEFLVFQNNPENGEDLS